MSSGNEKVLMTSFRQGNVSTISVERVEKYNRDQVYYEGSGQHTGLVINKQGDMTALSNVSDPEMQLEFTCIMVNKITDETHAENRRLKFWFKENVDQNKRLQDSYEFFKELINPSSFPKDYVGFIKKVMKQIQANRFEHLRRLDVDLIVLDKGQQEALVPEMCLQEKDMRTNEEIVLETLQKRLDEAFPNVISMDDLVNLLQVDASIIRVQLEDLIARDIIQAVPLEGKLRGQTGYRRNYPQVADEKVQVVNEGYAKVARDEKPTIAIITNLLCEKLAVDSMMTNRTTFVRYKTEGESHVYSIGYIGDHKVISTKLPMVGRLLKEKISSGNTTTRLLGAFQEIKHVFIVGVGGSVPYIYEFEKHSRLGDIVVSTPLSTVTDPAALSTILSNGSGHLSIHQPSAKDYMYLFCEKILYPDEDAPKDTPLQFILKYYKPEDTELQRHVVSVLDQYEANPDHCPWLEHMDNARVEEHDVDFTRPPPETDKLKIRMGGGMTFDIKHPEPPADMAKLYREGIPAVRLGCIGSGRPITDSDQLRDNFAKENHLLAWDAEYDQVLESIMGNRLGSYIFIRGISDYVDGSRGSQWQPYAALSAAAFMKSVILQIPK